MLGFGAFLLCRWALLLQLFGLNAAAACLEVAPYLLEATVQIVHASENRPVGGHHAWGQLLLCLLSETFCEYFFVFAWEFCIESGGDFLVNSFWSPFPMKQSTKNPRKIRGKFGAKFGAKSGTKIRKFGELWFCNFSDLSNCGSKKRHHVPTHRSTESELTKVANRNRSDLLSQGLNRKEIPQKDRDFRLEFAESNRNRY